MPMHNQKKQVRVFTDGCYDMMHYGHANSLRQAKEMGDYLVVGVHSSEEIRKHKGPPVMSDKERYAAVRGCKWVDEVVEDVPYVTRLGDLDKLNIDFVVHGDDISVDADGNDTYQAIKDAGRFKTCKRTPGVSTTDLVGRMLLMTKDHHNHEEDDQITPVKENSTENLFTETEKSPYTGTNGFLSTSRRIVQFSSVKEAQPGDKVVYVDGGFDLFHAGHIELFRKAKEMGDYLLVGVHSDKVINRIKGENFPLMNLQERVLSVLSCRYVDEVIIGAPFSVTKDVLEKLYTVTAVVHGKQSVHLENERDPYEIPKAMGIYHEVETEFSYLTTEIIIDRIISQREQFLKRNKAKEAKEIKMAKMKSAE